MSGDFPQNSARALRIVLDTNVIMDMLHFGNPHTHGLLRALTDGHAIGFTDRDCLEELERVTGYAAFGLDDAERGALLVRWRALSRALEPPADPRATSPRTPVPSAEIPSIPLPRCRDADDQKFLLLAARCGADLLVTRDKQLLRLARHRRIPPPFAILTAESASHLPVLLDPAAGRAQ